MPRQGFGETSPGASTAPVAPARRQSGDWRSQGIFVGVKGGRLVCLVSLRGIVRHKGVRLREERRYPAPVGRLARSARRCFLVNPRLGEWKSKTKVKNPTLETEGSGTRP